ncbi:MAG: phosphotransferase [Thermomicrobiales bacterium]
MNSISTTIPADPAELSPGWLTAALRDEGAIRTSAITKLTTEIIGADRGFTGVVARVVLAYDEPEPGAPATLVAKFPLVHHAGSSYRTAQQASPDLAQRYFERCAREARFYREIAEGRDPDPKLYGAWADLNTQRLLLLLEDISDGDPGDALLGCSIDQAALVVERLAPFHARWWRPADQPAFAWLPRWGSEPRARATRFQGQLESVLDRYRDRIPASAADVSRTLAGRYELILRALDQRPTTVIHGDLHLDNLIFTGGDGVALIDWQGVGVGPAIVDLGLFIVGALSVDDRRTAEMDLLARYHAVLAGHGVRGYSLADLVADYHRSLVLQLAGIVGWLARVDPASLEGRERALVDALFTPGQVFAACADHSEGVAALVNAAGK